MKVTLKTAVISCVCLVLLFGGNPAQSDLSKPLKSKPAFDMNMVERGRYLVRIAGCNDCHTAGYLLSEGKVDEELWLTGDTFGWRGPWGTTYGSNLRLPINSFTEAQWVDMAKTLRRRVPMPWYAVNDMKEEDLRAIYQFIRYLGPAGKPAPIYVPPDQEPSGPHATFPMPPK